MNILKKSLSLSPSMSLLAIGYDVNGNKIVRLELAGGKKKTVQLDSSVSISIDDVINGLTDKQINHIKDSV